MQLRHVQLPLPPPSLLRPRSASTSCRPPSPPAPPSRILPVSTPRQQLPQQLHLRLMQSPATPHHKRLNGLLLASIQQSMSRILHLCLLQTHSHTSLCRQLRHLPELTQPPPQLLLSPASQHHALSQLLSQSALITHCLLPSQQQSRSGCRVQLW